MLRSSIQARAVRPFPSRRTREWAICRTTLVYSPICHPLYAPFYTNVRSTSSTSTSTSSRFSAGGPDENAVFSLDPYAEVLVTPSATYLDHPPTHPNNLATQFANLFPLWIALGVTLALIHPPLFAWFSGPMVVVSLGFTMLAMGLTLTVEDFVGLARQPEKVLLGTTLQVSSCSISYY